MTVNGKQVAGGRLERTIPIQFSLGEGLDVGMDRGAPASMLSTLVPLSAWRLEKPLR